MKLSELEPRFVRLWGAGRGYEFVERIADAQGLDMLCPRCFVTNKGAIGTHHILCWSRSRGVPDDVTPGPGRWMLEGTSLADLTLNGDPPGAARSVLLNGPGCGAHFHITNGEVTWA